MMSLCSLPDAAVVCACSRSLPALPPAPPMPPIGIIGMPPAPIGRVPVAWAGAVFVPVPLALLVLVSGPTEKALRCCSAGRPVTSVCVLRPVALVPLVTGWVTVPADRPVADGVGVAGALGVTVACGVLL